MPVSEHIEHIDRETFRHLSAALDPKPTLRSEATSIDEIYLEVGRACARFERVQDELVAWFDFLCGGGPENVSEMALVIGATSSFAVKLDLVKAAARIHVSDARAQQAVLGWFKLAGRAAEVRNKIAHGQPTHVHYNHEGENLRAAFLMPSAADARAFGRIARVPQGPNFLAYRWTAAQVLEYSETFLRLRVLLMLAREQLAGALDPAAPFLLDPDTQARSG